VKFLRLIVSLVLVFALALPGVAMGAGDQPVGQSRAAGIIVKLRDGRDVSDLAVSGARGQRLGRSSVYRIRAGSSPARTLAALRANPAVEWAEPDYIREVTLDYTSTPNDPDFRDETFLQSSTMQLAHARSWYLRGKGSIYASDVWPYLAPAAVQQYGARASASAFRVAVIDSGFYMTHPDKGSNIVAAKDCLDTYTHATGVTTVDNDVTPVSVSAPGNDIYRASHGTCVAGEIAAGIDNGVGTAGAGYDTPVAVYKVQGVCVDGIPEAGIVRGQAVILDSAVIDAIHRATNDGCKVISMSLGGPDPSVALQDAVDYAHAHGVLVVAATGNNPTLPVQYPAACDNVIGVGSYRIDSNEEPLTIFRRSSFTSYGTGLDLLAPGEGIWGFIKPDYDEDGGGTVARPGYTMWDGTSMATPLVAAAAAALWRFVPFLSNDEMADLLFRSAGDMGPTEYDTGYGWGTLNMSWARYKLQEAYPELPAPALTVRPADAINTSSATFSWLPVTGLDVTYRASLDGVGQDLVGTTASYPALAEGHHSVTITAMSPRNWWDLHRSATTVDFLVDTITPTTPVVTMVDRVLGWTPTEPELREIRVRIDGGTEIVLPGTASSYSLASLALGPHVAEVRCVDLAGNQSGWGRVEFVLGDPPEAPVLAATYTTVDGSFTIDWPDAPRATGYRYVVDAGAPVVTATPAISLSSLPVGRYRLSVCAVNASGISAWTSASLLVEASPVPAELTVTPVEGSTEIGTDRIGTAIAASRLAFPDGSSPDVLIATAYDWPDALGGSALAGVLDAPILLTRQNELPQAVAEEIARLGASRVIILGGTGAVSTDVWFALRALPRIQVVERMPGADRYETARRVAARVIEESGVDWDGTALVVTGQTFPDALGGSPLSSARGWPVYLVPPDPAMHSALVAGMRDDGVTSALILGGTGAVPGGVEAGLDAALGQVTRLGGATRYETAVTVARHSVDYAGLSWDDLAIAVGEDFPDALAGGVLQGHYGSVVLLTRGSSLSDATRAELVARKDAIHEVRFFGGVGALTPAVRASVTSILAK